MIGVDRVEVKQRKTAENDSPSLASLHRRFRCGVTWQGGWPAHFRVRMREDEMLFFLFFPSLSLSFSISYQPFTWLIDIKTDSSSPASSCYSRIKFSFLFNCPLKLWTAGFVLFNTSFIYHPPLSLHPKAVRNSSIFFFLQHIHTMKTSNGGKSGSHCPSVDASGVNMKIHQ